MQLDWQVCTCIIKQVRATFLKTGRTEKLVENTHSRNNSDRSESWPKQKGRADSTKLAGNNPGSKRLQTETTKYRVFPTQPGTIVARFLYQQQKKIINKSIEHFLPKYIERSVLRSSNDLFTSVMCSQSSCKRYYQVRPVCGMQSKLVYK